MASNLKVDIIKPTATNGSLSLKGDSGGSATANGISVDSNGNTSITGTTTTSTASLDGAVTINDSGADVDFRVESDTDTHALFVEGSSGNVGVGASTVVAPFHVGTEGDQGITAWFGDDSSFVNVAGYHYSDARVGISGRDSDTTDRGAGVEFTCRNTDGTNWLHGYIVHNRDGAFTFGTGGVGSSSSTEAMRINSDKQVLIGTTSSLGTNGERLAIEHTFPVSGMTLNQTTSGTTYATEYRNQNNLVGFVRCSTTATTFGTSSDYRLKEDVQPMSGSIDRLKALKPVNFAWKIDGSRVDGFLAHEAQEIVPEAVSGEKDAVDADGNPEYQGVDYGRITPLLTSALQDAIEKIEILERRIAELEAR